MTKVDDYAKVFATKEFSRPFSETPEAPITVIDPDAYAGFKAGYKQAEKDLALTWEDIKVINILGSVVIEEHHDGWTAEDVWKEVLRRYNKSTILRF